MSTGDYDQLVIIWAVAQSGAKVCLTRSKNKVAGIALKVMSTFYIYMLFLIFVQNFATTSHFLSFLQAFVFCKLIIGQASDKNINVTIKPGL